MIITHKIAWDKCLSHQLWPAIEKGWKDEGKNVHFFWGLAGKNIPEIPECERKGEEWWYVDVGYMTEQITRYPEPKIHNYDNTYFRICKGNIHSIRFHVPTPDRWNILEKQDTWTIKVMKYQGIPKHIIEQMKKQADRIIILKRKDMLQQALSLCKSSMIQLWHNNLGKTLKANAGKLDYNQFAQKVLSIKEEEAWIEQNFTTAERLFYEDLDLSKSGYTKNDIHIDYDAARCEKIIRQLT